MAETLAGAWTGVYFYPHHPEHNPHDSWPPTPFTADLAEHEGKLSGRTREPDRERGDGVVLASIAGRRRGAAVVFTKTPDGRRDAIVYVGQLAAGGDRVEGEWHIHNDWSGTFRMDRVRKPAPAVTIADAAGIKI